MTCVKLVILLIFYNLANIFATNEKVLYSPHVKAILKHLNSNQYRVYEYLEATLVTADARDGATELVVDIRVNCLKKQPNTSCLENLLTCTGSLRESSQGEYEVLGDVTCIPKTVGSLKTSVEKNDDGERSHDILGPIRPENGPCVGCPVDLNSDAVGVDELVQTALKHVEDEKINRYSVVKIWRIQQEVVNGIKYLLTVEIVPTVCFKDDDVSKACPANLQAGTQVCHVIYVEKPWITNAKHVIANNCTTSQEFVLPELNRNNRNDLDNNIAPIRDNTVRDHQMSNARLADLESQILFGVEPVVNSRLDDSQLRIVPLFPEIEPTNDVLTPEPYESVFELNPIYNPPVLLRTTKSLSDVEYATVSQTTDEPASEGLENNVLPTQETSLNEENTESGTTEQSTISLDASSNSDSSEENSAKNKSEESTESRSSEETKNDVSGRLKHKDGDIEIRRKRSTGKRSRNSNIDNGGDSSSSSSSSDDDDDNGNNDKKKDLNKDDSSSSSSDEDKDDNNNNNDDDNNVDKEKSKKVIHTDESESSSSSSSEEKDLPPERHSSRNKRSIGQLEKISQEEKSLVRDLAEFAAATLDNMDDDDHKRVVLKLLGAKKLKLDGTYYSLILRLGISRCLEDKYPSSDEDCREKLFDNLTKVCKVQVHVNDDYSNPKVVKSQCQNIKRDEHDDRNRTNYSRYRRSSFSNRRRRGVPGGIENDSVDNPKALEYVKGSLFHLDGTTEHSNKLKVQKILSVSKQVVAGQLWRIRAVLVVSDCPKTDTKDRQSCSDLKGSEPRICDFKVWDRPWLQTDAKETEIRCENDVAAHKFRYRRAIQSFGREKYIIPSVIPGEIETNPEVLGFVRDALRYLDTQSPHDNRYIIREVLSVSKQTVSGKMWTVKAKIVLSDCPKRSNILYCEEVTGGENKMCRFRIWDKPWLQKGRQTNITCDNDETVYSFQGSFDQVTNNIELKKDDPDFQLSSFKDFMENYNKTYNSRIEYMYRFKVFRNNLRKIEALNKFEQGTAVYGVTRFTDLSEEEFSQSHGLRMNLRNENSLALPRAVIPEIDLPTEFDWRSKKVVTEVKDQGSCGSCWAFSVTGNVEGQYAIKYNNLLEFSEQELVDCDTEDQGCNGGLMDVAYRVIEKMGGLETEQDYPYDAEDEKCKFSRPKAKVQLTGALNISHDETEMAKWLVKNGPISIAINANAMQFYMGGVSHPFKMLCNPNNLDHGVLIVGYGVHKYPLFKRTLPYWIVKNSWGTSWGEQGYYRVFRGDGTCGLNQTPSSAVVA